MPDVVLESFYDIEIHKLFMLPIISVYKNPGEYPCNFVARLWDLETPTKYIILKNSLEEIRNAIPKRFFNLGRDPYDDSIIVETWI